MLRNKEIQLLLAVFAGIVLVVSLAAYLITPPAAWMVLLASALLGGCFFFYTTRRYRAIEELSGYLREIGNGRYSLDVRDNVEGELSILKNEIYKVTLMLTEQGVMLQEDKQRLTDAISDISHQIKTPLTSMMMMSDLLSNPALPSDKRSEFSHRIQIQLERLEWLISSLLKLSKIDAGTIVFKKEPVRVEKIIQKALEAVAIPIDVKELRVELQGDAEVAFIGDANWTTEAVINIVKNAAEHTEHGGMIHISYGENVLYTEIAIRDNGNGIARQDLPHIFNRFYKGSSAGEGSVGIGLAMAHSIITSQNGAIEVKSDSSAGGTEFRIKLYKHAK
ncbi:HAMP domain-containing sensor histidine kinase [Paenibacillus sp. HB172176]|uniref:sensor histidine kinase n=1 Tax=Paenibacillus sp. HB172176 TaxID=2493690 RepID=UPI001438B716|nr:HAMP domain-containing sensor histidine kinase [Paenibacillus sp. HB172176]